MRSRLFHLLFPLLIVACVAVLAFYVAINQSQPSAQVAPRTNHSLLPALGKPLRFGAFTHQNSTRYYEEKLGHQLDIVAWFQTWETPFVPNQLRQACNAHHIPQITLESWRGQPPKTNNPYPLHDIAAGKFDAILKSRFKEISQYCGRNSVIMRFNHEMDMRPGKVDWYPWQGNPQAYIAAWRHVVQLGRQYNPHMLWLWSPNRGTEYTPLYYPGSEWVDYVGLTLNNPQYGTKKYASFADFYGKQQAVIEAFNKPIIIGETAANEVSPAFRAKWVEEMFAYVARNPRITALVWFSALSPKGQSHVDYNITSSPESLAAFRRGLAVAREAR